MPRVPENPEHRPLRFRYSLPGTTRVVSLFEIFVPEFWKKNYGDGKFFKDRIVLVGATAERLHDFYLTPWGKLSGPEINLHALAAMLRGSWLNQAGLASTLVALVFAGLAAFSLDLLLPRKREISRGGGGRRRAASGSGCARLCFGSSRTFCRRPRRC